MISNRVIEFCLGVLTGAGIVLVVRMIVSIVGLVVMEVPR